VEVYGSRASPRRLLTSRGLRRLWWQSSCAASAGWRCWMRAPFLAGRPDDRPAVREPAGRASAASM